MRRGFTLLEVLVAAVLTLLVMGVAFGYLVPAWRASARIQTRVELQQSAVVALDRLTAELKTSAPGGVTLSDGVPRILAINPVEKVQGNGLVVWKSSYILYVFEGDRLERIEWPPGGPAASPSQQLPTRAKRLPRSQLVAIASAGDVARRQVAGDVVDFSWTHPGSPDVFTQPLTFRLELSRATSAQPQAERVVLQRSVHLVNQQ